MIKLRQINGDEVVVNADLIESMEQAHDTIVILTTGRRLRVQEKVDEIIDKVVEYRRRVNSTGKSPDSVPENPQN